MIYDCKLGRIAIDLSDGNLLTRNKLMEDANLCNKVLT